LAAKGVRRAVRAFADELTWVLHSDSGSSVLRLAFTLPRGVYATALLREVMKPAVLVDGARGPAHHVQPPAAYAGPAQGAAPAATPAGATPAQGMRP
jgi:hypothetical protein